MTEQQLQDLARAAIAVFVDEERDEYMLVMNYADNSEIRASEEVVLTITRRHRIKTTPLQARELVAV